MRAIRIHVTHTLTIRRAYAGYTRYTLYTLEVRYEYAIHTFVKTCIREAGLKVVRIRSFSEICICFLKFAYAMHTL